jgi:hypothetical protein
MDDFKMQCDKRISKIKQEFEEKEANEKIQKTAQRNLDFIALKKNMKKCKK